MAKRPRDPQQPALEVDYVDVDELIPYARNAKLHPDEQVDAIAASIERFGECDPVGVWTRPDGRLEIVEGHGRILALKKLGRAEVPIIRLDHLDDDARRAYTHIHNQTTMSSGFDTAVLAADMAELPDFEWSEYGFEAGGPGVEPVDVFQDDHESAFDAAAAAPRVQPGEIWRLGDHVLICGDATHHETIQRLIAAGGGVMADMLLTDPPYGVGLGTDEQGHPVRPSEMKQRRRRTDGQTIDNDSLGADEFQDFIVDAMMAADPALKPGAAFYIWFAAWRTRQIFNALAQAGYEVRQELYWIKQLFTLGRQDYQWQTEPAVYGWKDGAGHYFAPTRSERNVIDDGLDTSRMSKEELREVLDGIIAGIQTDAIREDRPMRSEEHPTMKPVALFARLMRNSTRPGETVLDPFMGSGTTIIAAEQMERRALGCELDPHYCDVIVNRWERLTGREAVRA